MSKRTPGFPRRPNEFWATPRAAVAPLVPHLPTGGCTWIEPCAGDGDLARHLVDLWPAGGFTGAYDIAPRAEGVMQADAMEMKARPGLYITNPPWPRQGQRGEPVIGMAKHLAALAPTWLLLPWDFAANAYFAAVASICHAILPIGRVSWMGNGEAGKDNAAWYLFHSAIPGAGPRVLARGGAK